MSEGEKKAEEEPELEMEISSPAYFHKDELPIKYTLDGEGISPPLLISNVPPKAKSLVLIFEDPDQPQVLRPDRYMTRVHWIIYNLPPTTTRIEENAGSISKPNHPGLAGTNDWHRKGYRAPNSNDERHRYNFRLYALDTMLPDMDAPMKRLLKQAMADHVIADAYLQGTWKYLRF